MLEFGLDYQGSVGNKLTCLDLGVLLARNILFEVRVGYRVVV